MRKIIRHVPARPNYLHHTLANGDIWVFRITEDHARLAIEWCRDNVAKEIGKDSDGAPLYDGVSVSNMVDAFGAVLGLCWFHPALEIEAPSWRNTPYLQYGSMVREELATLGATREDIGDATRVVVDALKAQLITAAEVDSRADFSEATQEPTP